MVMHRQGVILAHPLEDVDASGRRSARKRLRKAAPMFKSQIAAAALIAATVAGCNKTSPPLPRRPGPSGRSPSSTARKARSSR